MKSVSATDHGDASTPSISAKNACASPSSGLARPTRPVNRRPKRARFLRSPRLHPLAKCRIRTLPDRIAGGDQASGRRLQPLGSGGARLLGNARPFDRPKRRCAFDCVVDRRRPPAICERNEAFDIRRWSIAMDTGKRERCQRSRSIGCHDRSAAALRGARTVDQSFQPGGSDQPASEMSPLCARSTPISISSGFARCRSFEERQRQGARRCVNHEVGRERLALAVQQRRSERSAALLPSAGCFYLP